MSASLAGHKQQFLPCSNGNTHQKTACSLTIAQSKPKLAVQVFAKSPTSITATSWFVCCGHHIMSSCVYFLPSGVQSTSFFYLYAICLIGFGCLEIFQFANKTKIYFNLQHFLHFHLLLLFFFKKKVTFPLLITLFEFTQLKSL